VRRGGATSGVVRGVAPGRWYVTLGPLAPTPAADTEARSSPAGPLRVRLARRAEGALRRVWERARNERSSPVEIALSVGVGVFAACTPFWGAHLFIALGLATLLRLNRLWAAIASRFAVTPVFILVAFAEIEAAHRVRAGTWISLAPAALVARGRELVIDWALGAALVGGAIAAAAAALAYALAVSWPEPDAARPPSSESPP